MARPTKLTDPISKAIVDALRLGAYVETAAEAAGVHVSTVYNWLDRGAADEEPYAAFFDAVTRARARAELDLLKAVRAGDSSGKSFGKAKSATWLLERTRGEKYASRLNVKIDDAVADVLEVARGVCSQQDFEKILERLQRKHREGGDPLPAGDAVPDEGGLH